MSPIERMEVGTAIAHASFAPPTVLKIPATVAAAVPPAVAAARQYLLERIEKEGFWVGELEADTTLESDYILLEFYLGLNRPEKIRKAANYILSKQLPDGGWNIYHGGPSNVSATVKAYLGLKLAGYPAEHPVMKKAREAALRLGGVQASASTG